ncbi:helix-turn-helix transcriptional regulator [Aeoliella sp. ICT_H6.2]|uniref:Helix-turn-helix transcriptional regulator n=1 Tax=Aeoliella straminimaris TaxID=2954799 RepID=A0A9X2F8Y9_9BACT|nr:helix-turn-helix transcriptional regulator [Aeoliella straminimaris]MCO6044049.1 helix-turn-helix transcriptional regulator [Aeoliella straminimaris]
MASKEFSSDLVRSCADMVILTLLGEKPMHGYDILVSMGDLGDGQFRIKQGTLYPLLYRLEREGWITAKWQEPPSGKKRKVYRLTAEGKRIQQQRAGQWQRFTKSINAIMKDCSNG